jgi:hypothetical protein
VILVTFIIGSASRDRRRARRPEEFEHLAVHGARRRREGPDRDAARGLGNVPGAMVAGPDARHDRDPLGRLYRHHERDLFSFLILILILLFRPTGSVRHAHRRAKVAMFDGLIDGYTQSILIFTGISVIAAYSFFAPFKTGRSRSARPASWRSAPMRRRC